jgi:hypothetical protein
MVTMFLDAAGKYVPDLQAEARALFRYSETGRLARLLADLGFEDAVPERSTEWAPFVDVEAYWQTMVNTPFGRAARSLSPEAVAECKTELEKRTRFYRRGGHLELKVEAVILGAVKG